MTSPREENSEPAAPDFGDAIFRQALDLWINPEIERRKHAGTLPANFCLQRAQVVMNVDQPLQVRLNEEIKAIVRVRVKKAINKGEPVYLSDIDEIESVELTDHDPNAGHLTMINHRSSWTINFDFRYNAQRIHDHLAATKEFLDTAEHCLEQKRYRPFYENMFAAVELCQKAWLLNLPIPELITSKKHGLIHAKINSHSRHGNIKPQHVQLLNQLAAIRPKARYLNGVFSPTPQECSSHLTIGKELLAFVEASSPRRAKEVASGRANHIESANKVAPDGTQYAGDRPMDK